MDILFLFIGLVIGFALAYFFLKSKAGIDDKSAQLQEQLFQAEKENSVLNERASNLKVEFDKTEVELSLEREKLEHANSRLAKAEEAFRNQEQKWKEKEEKFATEFENIANKILDEKSKKFTEQNKTQLDIILNPLKENIDKFQNKVEQVNKESIERNSSLKEQLKGLQDLNLQMTKEAENLTKALKGDSKKQGNWGEIQLERILERSGLIKGQEYEVQVSASDDDGKRFQPDVVVKLPDEKHVIVDSKVSLKAYTDFVNEEDEDKRADLLKLHITSIRTHIKGLSDKDYYALEKFKSPDFVLLFVPSEASFSAAIQADPEIFNYAWDRKIVIVSPSTLLATLRTIASIWKQERQNKNALEIAKQSGALYDKFVGFVEDMKGIDKGLKSTRKSYNDALNKLSEGTGNLVRRAERIKELGANTKKSLPEEFIENQTPNTTLDFKADE